MAKSESCGEALCCRVCVMIESGTDKWGLRALWKHDIKTTLTHASDKVWIVRLLSDCHIVRYQYEIDQTIDKYMFSWFLPMYDWYLTIWQSDNHLTFETLPYVSVLYGTHRETCLSRYNKLFVFGSDKDCTLSFESKWPPCSKGPLAALMSLAQQHLSQTCLSPTLVRQHTNK